MSFGPFQIVIILLVILVLFGRGRISELMGDFGKGVKSFRRGLEEPVGDSPRLDSAEVSPAVEPVSAVDKPVG